MTWQEKILAGMELISQGCEENESAKACKTCPFTDFCDDICDGKYADDWRCISELFYDIVNDYKRVKE